MPNFFTRSVIGVTVLFALLRPGTCFAEESSGSVNSKYFNVTIHQGVSETGLLKKLRADYFLQMGAAFAGDGSRNGSTDALLGRTLDAIYLNVSDILDIHMYSFSIELDIFPDRRALAGELGKYLDKKPDVPSFYFYDKNRIYISYNDLTLGMLSHEIAHAIISHYFAVQPSVKVQEILAGYAEYSMRKVVK